MKRLVIACAIALTAAAASARPHVRPAHRGAQMRRLAKQLNLSDAQQQQIRDIHQAARERNQQLYADFRTKFRQFRELKRAGDPAADNLRAELKPLRDQIRAARKATRELVRGVLTPEQRQQLDERMAARQRRRRG